ncbi:MAG TPA: 16S rRNA (guanine(966)-N(2))-methyltransferase RsmD [Candidatus Binataceae bacterium]|nr:16S rRNA (guanine(966)-N(2))-methyltransferase RsmD [Candidatus Binataceae bacterium]
MNSFLRFTNQEHVASVLRKPNLHALVRGVVRNQSFSRVLWRTPALRIISGEAHGRRLKAPRGLRTRPATARARASIFSTIAARLDLEGVNILDIFAGSGSLGIEALSRGAASATFIDSSREAAATIRENLENLGLAERGTVISVDVFRALAELGPANRRFGVVFIDAPWTNDMSAKVLEDLARHGLVQQGGWVIVRQSRRAAEAPQAPTEYERFKLATLGDHRIAFYRRREDGTGEDAGGSADE